MTSLTGPRSPSSRASNTLLQTDRDSDAREDQAAQRRLLYRFPRKKVDFDSNAEVEHDIAFEHLVFYQNVSTNKDLRDASTKAEEHARNFANQELMREDRTVTAAANWRKTGAWDGLSAEQKRLVDKMLLDGKRAGLALEQKEDKETLKRLKLKDELSEA